MDLMPIQRMKEMSRSVAWDTGEETSVLKLCSLDIFIGSYLGHFLGNCHLIMEDSVVKKKLILVIQFCFFSSPSLEVHAQGCWDYRSVYDSLFVLL